MATVASTAPSRRTGANSRPSSAPPAGAASAVTPAPTRRRRPRRVAPGPAAAGRRPSRPAPRSNRPGRSRPRSGRARRSARRRPAARPGGHGRVFPFVPFTRVGWAAMYVGGVLDLIWSDRNSVDEADAKWPTTTTGMSGLEELGRRPDVVHDDRLVAAPDMTKSVPHAVRRIVPGTTVPSSRNVVVPTAVRWAKRLVDRVEVVERAAQPFDEQEDDCADQDGDDDEQPKPPTAAGVGAAPGPAASSGWPGGRDRRPARPVGPRVGHRSSRRRSRPHRPARHRSARRSRRARPHRPWLRRSLATPPLVHRVASATATARRSRRRRRTARRRRGRGPSGRSSSPRRRSSPHAPGRLRRRPAPGRRRRVAP